MRPNRDAVNAAIDSEREYQQKQQAIGAQTQDLQPMEEITIMRAYLDKAEHRFVTGHGHLGNDADGTGQTVLDELRKVIAVGVRCLENHGAPLRTFPTGRFNEKD